MLSSLLITSQAPNISSSAMAAEQVLNLFDYYWFETTIFSQSNSSLDSNSQSEVEVLHPPGSKLSRISSFEMRSFSDQHLDTTGSFSSDFSSPNSVLYSPKLRTILSGKEVGEFSVENHEIEEKPIRKKPRHSHKRTRRGKTISRSLSELEFKELKGFMDLGFVFSEEDKDSKLVSLIPGLQRLGIKDREGKEGGKIDETVISRPYLSEAWEALDQRKAGNSLMNWRVPALGNEIDMKDNLRFWAHRVASIVR
ncbi:hypothetical protein L6164_018591 [Bauhinia variegata]|uniref:Uncharacterized protein n=1 Tax=Bauhinia variegata TaxID=167791 RepID=A0ACB9NGI2_BAUVA|nr:hypothetical protein L6164_018591 [Bauhinia variegata]